jgi:putative acetyltransferase
MDDAPRIVIAPADPRSPASVRLVAELDEHLNSLYPAESNYLMDLNALAAPDVAFFTAHVNDDVVGCGAIKRYSDYAEVKRIYVAPRARGLGIARKLLTTLEDAARDAGLTLMRLETGHYQPDAIALFEKAGFHRRGSFGDYRADDPYSVFMERQLP